MGIVGLGNSAWHIHTIRRTKGEVERQDPLLIKVAIGKRVTEIAIKIRLVTYHVRGERIRQKWMKITAGFTILAQLIILAKTLGIDNRLIKVGGRNSVRHAIPWNGRSRRRYRRRMFPNGTWRGRFFYRFKFGDRYRFL